MISNQSYSNHFKAKHQIRCGQYYALSSIFVILLAIVMLCMALTTQFSEQKTTYWIVFVLMIIVFGVLLAIAIQQIKSGHEKQTIERTYKTNLSFIQKQYLNAQINSLQNSTRRV